MKIFTNTNATTSAWGKLSGPDQTAVGFAMEALESGEADNLDDAARFGVRQANEGYEDMGELDMEAFYEPVYRYLMSIDLDYPATYKSSTPKKKVSSATLPEIDEVRTYRNNRNENKYMQAKKYKDGHTYSRQFMKWDTPEGTVVNDYGSVTNRGRFHRTNQNMLRDQLEDYTDYEEVTSATRPDGPVPSPFNQWYHWLTPGDLQDMGIGVDEQDEYEDMDQTVLDAYGAQLVGYLVANENVYEPLSFDGLDLLTVVTDDKGKQQVWYIVDDRCYPALDDVYNTLEDVDY